MCTAILRFITKNWIEWASLHVLVMGVWLLLADILAGKEYPSELMSYLLWMLFYGPFLTFILIIRGVLFAELTHRYQPLPC